MLKTDDMGLHVTEHTISYSREKLDQPMREGIDWLIDGMIDANAIVEDMNRKTALAVEVKVVPFANVNRGKWDYRVTNRTFDCMKKCSARKASSSTSPAKRSNAPSATRIHRHGEVRVTNRAYIERLQNRYCSAHLLNLQQNRTVVPCHA